MEVSVPDTFFEWQPDNQFLPELHSGYICAVSHSLILSNASLHKAGGTIVPGNQVIGHPLSACSGRFVQPVEFVTVVG